MREPTPSQLREYLDGRLAPADHAAVRLWLTANPSRHEELLNMRRELDKLREYRRISGEETAKPPAPKARARKRCSIPFGAAIAVAFVVGGLAGCLGHRQLLDSVVAVPMPTPVPAPMGDAIEAHRLFANNPNFLPDRTDANADAWLLANFGRASAAPDLRNAGYFATGVRMLATDRGPAAIVVYHDAQDHAISYYVRPVTAFLRSLRPGGRVAGAEAAEYWTKGQYSYAMVASARDASARRLIAVERAKRS